MRDTAHLRLCAHPHLHEKVIRAKRGQIGQVVICVVKLDPRETRADRCGLGVTR